LHDISSGFRLFKHIGNERQQSQVACTLYGGGYLFLEFLRSSGQAAGQDFALFVEELFQEFGVFVIDVFDAGFFETAVFFLFDLYGRRVQVSDFGLILCHDLLFLF
jgi:hypothetical protein